MRALRALAWLCLASLTTACAERPQVITQTVYQQVYLPERFLVPCARPRWEPGGTYRDVSVLAVKRGTAIDDCNEQLRAARDYQAEIRAKAAAVMQKK